MKLMKPLQYQDSNVSAYNVECLAYLIAGNKTCGGKVEKKSISGNEYQNMSNDLLGTFNCY